MYERIGGISDLPSLMGGLSDGENDEIALLSNASALIMDIVPDLNWAGFYRRIGKTLVLGPFQGKPACVRIPFGKGVCGTAAEEGKVQIVEDVHAFKGHIACDGASASEMVVPIYKNGELFGVLDIDSPMKGRFTEIADIIILTAREIEKALNF